MNASPFAIRILFAHLIAAGLASSSWAADIVLTPPAGGGVAVNSAVGNATRFRVADDGTVTIPTIAASAAGASGLCVEIATGKVGTCSIGTLTNLATGAGLTGGPITTTGTIGLAATQLLPTVACTTNQIPKWSGTAWTCAADASGGVGTVTSIIAGAGLTGGTITSSGTIAVDPASATLTGAFFKQNGNSFGATASLGTNDNQVLEFKANNVRTVRIEPNTTSPNIITGLSLNAVTPGAYGGTIGGGGETGTPSGSTSYYVLSGQYFSCPLSGCFNRVTDAYGTVAGGVNNQAGDGAGTTTDRTAATVGGGFNNLASGLHSTVAGGGYNIASGSAPTGNTTGNTTVGGGYGNTASGDGSTVSGGVGSLASGAFSVAAGSGNRATGDYSLAPGGGYNTASGIGSFAAGTGARTETGGVSPTVHNGAFVWADNSLAAIYTFNTVAANEFAARSTGGVRFVTGVTALPGATYAVSAGVSVGAGGGSWASLSDVAAKRDLAPVNTDDVLARLASMPVYHWRYIAEKSNALHLGPTSQDFQAAFGLGDSDKTITTIDEGGVALAAIQGLHRIVREQESKLAEQQETIANLSARLADAESLKGDLVAVKAVLSELLRDRASGASRKASLVQ